VTLRFFILVIASILPAADTPSPTTMFFVPSGEFTGPYQRVGLSICSTLTGGVIHQTHSDFLRDAGAAGWTIATYSELLAAASTQDRRSWQRSVLLGVEVVGWLVTALTAAELVEIKEKYLKGGSALLSGTLRFTTTIVQPPKFQVPSNMRPPIVVLAPGECSEFTFYATKR
jgi:hypothetical protein